MIWKCFTLSLWLLLGLPLSSHAQSNGCDEPRLNVVATVGMIADVAGHIGGDCVTLITMMGPGVDPHVYSATLRDVENLFEADLILYGGLHLEARLIDVFEQIHESLGTTVIPVSESIAETSVLHVEDSNATDPHIWMDVSLWMDAARAIRDGFVTALPENASYITANAEAYLAQMEALDVYVMEQIQRIPETQRILITAHDAFQYYSRRYAVDVYAPQGISTQAEVGVQDVRETIDLILSRQIPAIFVETSVSPAVVEAIQAGAQARGWDLQIGGQLYSDAMGTAGTLGGTYLGMIQSNTDTIVSSLLGENETE